MLVARYRLSVRPIPTQTPSLPEYCRHWLYHDYVTARRQPRFHADYCIIVVPAHLSPSCPSTCTEEGVWAGGKRKMPTLRHDGVARYDMPDIITLIECWYHHHSPYHHHHRIPQYNAEYYADISLRRHYSADADYETLPFLSLNSAIDAATRLITSFLQVNSEQHFTPFSRRHDAVI